MTMYSLSVKPPQYRLYNRFAISVPDSILRHYAWGLDFSAKLSTAYILPKPSRMFKKARPIINYSTSWPQKLGQAIGIALLEILNIVYYELLKLQDVHAALYQIRLLFQAIVLLMNGFLKSINLTSLVFTIKWNMIEFFMLLILQFIVSVLYNQCFWNRPYRHILTSWNVHYVCFGASGDLRASSFENLNWLLYGILSNYYFKIRSFMSTLTIVFLFSSKLYASTSDPVILETGFLYCSYTFGRRLLGTKFWVFASIRINERSLSVNPGHKLCVAVVEVVSSRNIIARCRLIVQNVWPPHVRDAHIQDFVGLIFLTISFFIRFFVA